MRRLTILIATVGALLLVPVAQAAAELTVNIKGGGSGEVTSVGGMALLGPGFEEYAGVYEGEPPIECTYDAPGPSAGSCENEMTFEEGDFFETLKAIPDPGFALGSIVLNGGVGYGQCSNSNPEGWEACFVQSGTGEVEATVAFIKPNLKLNVEEGEGTVVSNPAGLECTGLAPKTCEAEVAEGKFTLTASPAPGYLVKSWKGCDVGGVNGRQCTVTATNSLKNVGVKFYKVFRLNGSKSGGQGIMGTAPGGINCGYACSSSTALFKEGSLTVKAKPAKHFHFVEFTDGTGSAESCNGVTLESCTIASFSSNSAIKEVYAEDAKNTLTLGKLGGGQGFVKTTPSNINCGYTCTDAAAQFYASESAAITVSLNKGTTSVEWTTPAGTCEGNALTCTVPMSESHELVAKFN